MKTTNIVKGVPIYVYHGRQYMDKPDKLICGKMKYDESANITYIKMHRATYFIEIVAMLIIAGCVYYSFVNNVSEEQTARYNSIVTYYDKYLYLNWNNPEENYTSITYNLYDGKSLVISRTLAPGESLITYEYEPIEDNLTLVVSTKRFKKNVSVETSVRVINRNRSEVE